MPVAGSSQAILVSPDVCKQVGQPVSVGEHLVFATQSLCEYP